MTFNLSFDSTDFEATLFKANRRCFSTPAKKSMFGVLTHDATVKYGMSSMYYVGKLHISFQNKGKVRSLHCP